MYINTDDLDANAMVWVRFMRTTSLHALQRAMCNDSFGCFCLNHMICIMNFV